MEVVHQHLAKAMSCGEVLTAATSMSQSSTFSFFITAMRTQNRTPTTIKARLENVQVKPMTRGPRPRSLGLTGGGKIGIAGGSVAFEADIVNPFFSRCKAERLLQAIDLLEE
jgi:hypothetical protein